MPKRITEDEARRRLEGRDDVKLVEYVGTAKDAEADAKFTEALRNNQRGDNYTLLAVLFAAVLFFTAMSGRPERVRSTWAMLGFGFGLCMVGIVFLVSFPKVD